MQITIEKKEGAEVSLKVEISREKMEEETSRAFQTLVKEIKVPGFRKGKVPRRIFEARFGKETLQEEAMRRLYPQIYKKIENDHKLIPIMDPKVEILPSAADEPFILKVNLVTKPKVEVTSYQGIKVKRKKIEIREEEVTKALKQVQKQHIRYVSIKENRGAKEGDWIVIDWEVKSSGKRPFQRKEKDLLFQLGSSIMPAAFSKGLIGIKRGESRRLEVKFPSQYSRKEFAGKKIIFRILLKDIRKEELPQIDDELARELKYNDLKSLKEDLKERIEKAKRIEEERRLKKEIVKKVVDSTFVSLPSPLVEEKIEEKMEEISNELEKKGYSLGRYLKEENLKESQLREKLRPGVEENLKTFFVLDAIAEKENITVEEKEIKEKLKNLLNIEREEELEKLKNHFIRTGKLKILKNQIKEEKVIELLYNKADIK